MKIFTEQLQSVSCTPVIILSLFSFNSLRFSIVLQMRRVMFVERIQFHCTFFHIEFHNWKWQPVSSRYQYNSPNNKASNLQQRRRRRQPNWLWQEQRQSRVIAASASASATTHTYLTATPQTTQTSKADKVPQQWASVATVATQFSDLQAARNQPNKSRAATTTTTATAKQTSASSSSSTSSQA